MTSTATEQDRTPVRSDAPILDVQDVSRVFKVQQGAGKQAELKAVTDVSLTVRAGTTLGIVGESGSGKSTLANMVCGMLPPTSGEIVVDGEPVYGPNGKRRLIGDQGAQIVFQDPYSSLNPRMAVKHLVEEPLRVAPRMPRAQREQRVDELLDQVGLPRSARDKFAHEFSGGQRQRLVIARALARRPRVLVCDEPVSALDVSVQSQILNLLKDLQDELGLTYLFIGHGLESVGFMSDEIAVMYLGRIVEQGPAEQVLTRPVHPYTGALIASSEPVPFAQGGAVELTGEIPSPLRPPSGCVFRTRCPLATAECAGEVPRLTVRENGHFAACVHR